MKHSRILFTLLIVIVLVWGTVQILAQRQRRWVSEAGREELGRYVEAHPDQTDALVRLAKLLLNHGQREQAERLARRAVEIAPQEEAGWVTLSNTIVDGPQAIDELERFLRVQPESAPVLAEMARRYLQAGDTTTARTLTEKATKLAPEAFEVWRARGDVMAALRQTPAAESAYKRALSLRDDVETRLSLAHILIPLQRYTEILQLCAPIVQMSHSDDISQAQRARALIYTAGGRLYFPLTTEEVARVQKQLQEAETLSGQLSPQERFLAAYFLGESLLQQGKAREAIPYLEHSVAAGPMFAGSRYSLARAYQLAGDQAKANRAFADHARLSRILGELEMYNNRLEQRPDDTSTLIRLAEVLTEAGDVSNAEKIYRNLISRGQALDIATRKLKELPQTH